MEVERSLGLIWEARAAVDAAKAQSLEPNAGWTGVGMEAERESGPPRASPSGALASPGAADRARAEELLQEAAATGDLSRRSWLISQAVQLYMRADDASGPRPEFRLGRH